MACTKRFKWNFFLVFCSFFGMQMSWLATLCSVSYRGIGGNGSIVVNSMSINSKRESHISKMYCSPHLSRARFLSSSAAVFVTASAGMIGFVMANSPEECLAAPESIGNFNDNPRYIETELQMKYGESPGMLKNH
jgi:hypothetical protein